MLTNKLGNLFKGDKVIWMIFFILAIVSIVEVYSASSQLSYKKGNYISPILWHSIYLLVGVVVMIVTLQIRPRYFKVITAFMVIASIIMLIWATFFGERANDASRWIIILGIKFQPSEIAKGALVLATAKILSDMQTETGCDKRAIKYIGIICVFIIGLIMLENLSTAIILCAVVYMMMIVGRVPASQLGKIMGVCLLGVVFIVFMVMALGKEETPTTADEAAQTELVAENVDTQNNQKSSGLLHRFGTWKGRIKKFTKSISSDEEIKPEDIDLDKDAQVAYANIAIATSNIIGKGPGNSVECDFLSQAFSDFIYAIIIEELGLLGAFIIAALYIILLFRAGHIANNCENSFPAYVVMGLALLMVTQALFNMGVAVGLAPVTGQPLPLVSRGGTSNIITCFYFGMMLSISRFTKKRNAEKKEIVAEEVTD